MSAPNTNVKRQEKRHRPAIWGIGVALLIAILAAVAFGFWDGVEEEEQAAPATTEATE